MKSKRIIASVAAMTVLAMSTSSFAAVIIGGNTKTDTITVKKAGVELKVNSTPNNLGKIVSEAGMKITAAPGAKLTNTAVESKSGELELSGLAKSDVKDGSISGNGTVKEDPDVK